MGRPTDYHTKQSKSERERQIPYNITYIWNLKYNTNDISIKQKQQMNISIKQKQLSDIEDDLWLPRGMEGGGRKDWEFEISRCKLV